MDKNESVRITVLCENTAGVPLGVKGEWGLALLVETRGKKILLDTGQSASLLSNARALGIDLGQIDALVLSHGHYDHTGGLLALLEHRGKTPVYAHRELFAAHYAQRTSPVYIGVPFKKEELEKAGGEFIFIDAPLELAPGVWVSGGVPRKTTFGEGDGRLCCPSGGGYANDDIPDDMSLYCVTPRGVVIILGCAHAGLVNIVDHARVVTGIDRIYGIIGGTHLGPVPKEQQESAIALLKELDLSFLAANHCTGLPLMAKLKSIFGDRFHFAPVGASFNLPLA